MMAMSVRGMIADMIYPEGLENRRSLERAVETDPMTGLANRRAFDKALPAAEADQGTAIVLFDINNLGMANKICGHRAGDLMVQLVAEYIKTALIDLGVGERGFRIGGDEFAILCPWSASVKLINFVELVFGGRRFIAGGKTVVVSVSGTQGSTFDEADSFLQPRKARQKEDHARNLGLVRLLEDLKEDLRRSQS